MLIANVILNIKELWELERAEARGCHNSLCVLVKAGAFWLGPRFTPREVAVHHTPGLLPSRVHRPGSRGFLWEGGPEDASYPVPVPTDARVVTTLSSSRAHASRKTAVLHCDQGIAWRHTLWST